MNTATATIYRQEDENEILQRWADAQGASRGYRPPAPDALTNLQMHYIRRIMQSPIMMTCGRFYQWDEKENMQMRVPIEGERAILRLFRRGFIIRKDGRIQMTQEGNRVFEVNRIKGQK